MWDIDAPSLPEVLDYTGEFGAELVLFMPFCQWLSRRKLLAQRTIRTYAGMRCFYDNLKCREIIEKTDDRIFVPPDRRPEWMPIRDEHSLSLKESRQCLLYPDLRSRFSSYPLPAVITNSTKPLLIIHNKYNIEWDSKPINYIPLPVLEMLFATLNSLYTIIYIRHGVDSGPGYSKDHNTALPWQDNEVLCRNPEILSFSDLYRVNLATTDGHRYDLNTFKNAIYSRCYRFITSQGGGAHHIALFSGSLLAILHRQGRELEQAYFSGYYSFMTTPPPTRLICTHDEDLDTLVPILRNSYIRRGKIYLHRSVHHFGQQLEARTPSKLRYKIFQRLMPSRRVVRHGGGPAGRREA